MVLTDCRVRLFRLYCTISRSSPVNRPFARPMPVTWYKIKYTGEQVTQGDIQNNAPAFEGRRIWPNPVQ